MRSTNDRIRHTLMFEIGGLILCTPLAAWVLDKELLQIGSLSIMLSLTAMALNYIYNLVFDIVLLKLGRPVHVRPAWMRVVHAVLFEASLVVMTIPMVAWWLDMTLWVAFLTDLGFTVFFLFYTFFYNWAYDVVFPMPVEVAVKNHNEPS